LAARRWPITGADNASSTRAIVLHLLARYVSKAAILTAASPPFRSRIEVQLEFQGLKSERAASGDGFSLGYSTSFKERARGI